MPGLLLPGISPTCTCPAPTAPQDEPTARAVGSRSYNELVVQLVTSLGNAATPKQLTPCGSLQRGQNRGPDGLTPHASGAVGAAGSHLPAICEDGGEGGPAAGQQEVRQTRQGQFVDAEALSAALRNSLRLSHEAGQAPHPGDAEPGSSGPASGRSWAGRGGPLGSADCSRAASSLSSLQASDSMKSMVNRMLTDLVSVSGAHAGWLPGDGKQPFAGEIVCGLGGRSQRRRGCRLFGASFAPGMDSAQPAPGATEQDQRSRV